ncbi:MAG: hypothetical protein IIZ59_00100 [Clostridia bacterium]|nr:hypothetical protein [Clostridia bacterium]
MSAEKMIKSEAKRALSGNWPAAVTALFVSAMVPVLSILMIAASYSVIGDEEVGELLGTNSVETYVFVGLNVAAVAALLLLLPIWCGMTRFLGKLAAGEEADVVDVFYFLENSGRYKKAAAFMAGLAMKCVGTLIVCTLPALLFLMIDSNDDIIVMLAIILAAVGAIIALLWMHRFAFSTVLFSYKDYDPASAKKTGKTIAKGNTKKLIKITFKSIPWYLSLFLVVPFIYVIPYLGLSYTVSMKYIINDYFDRLNNTQTMPANAQQPQPVPAAPMSPIDENQNTRNPFESVPDEKIWVNPMMSAPVSLDKTEDGEIFQVDKSAGAETSEP